MSLINDDKFMRQALDNQDASQIFNQRSYNKADLIGIGDKDRWEASKLAGLVGVDRIPEDDPLPVGTHVEFTAPDNTTYKGRVASKSGKDYVVEVSHGESYLVPPGRLAKITPESKQVKEAMQRYVAPDIEIISKPAIEIENRCCARIAYRSRRPSDNELIRWAEEKYPDWRLVDAIDGNNREIGLVFEIVADKVAYEDTKPQGHEPIDRNDPLSSPEFEGTGVEPESAKQPHKDAGKHLSMNDAYPEETNFNLGKIAQVEDKEVVHLFEHPEDPNSWIAEFEDGMMVFSTEERGLLVTPNGKVEELTGALSHDYDRAAQMYQGPSVSMDESLLAQFEQVMGIQKEAQALGEPGGAEAYEDLVRAARWVLARFNDSNPEFYAIPQEPEMAGEGDNRVVRLSFTLQKQDGDDLNHMYISRSGKLEDVGGSDSSPARGYVQVDSEGNLPMIMLRTPIGPESVQEYGFDFTAEKKLADYDACVAAADDVLSEYGGYSANAQADFESRLVKLGVDPKAKEYWSGYFKEYGKMFTRDIPRKKHKTTNKQEKKENKPKKKSKKEPLDLRKLANKKVAVDQRTKDYWVNYFGSGAHNDSWYGQELVKDIPRRTPDNKNQKPDTKVTKEAIRKIASDYVGYIKEEGGKYCVKSESNPDWSGGCYDTKSEAENRLQQVEYFKHKGIRTCIEDGHVPTSQELSNLINLGLILKNRTAQIESAWKGPNKRKKQEVQMGGLFGGTVSMQDLTQVAQWAMKISEDDQSMYEAIYGLVYDYLRKNPGFLPTMLDTNTLDERGVGFTLLYALRDSPRAFKKFKKHINKYQKRYESKQWKELEKQTKEWRQKQREMRRKKKEEPKKTLSEGPTETGEEPEELVVELEEEEQQPVDVQPEEFTILDEPESQQPQQQQPTPPPPPSGAVEQGGSWLHKPTPEEIHKYSERNMIIRQAEAAPGPTSHNAPGKDDKQDYDYHERRKQPARNRNRFSITRMYSTTASSDNGYIYMDIAWDPDGTMKDLGPQNMKQQIISYVKGLESTKEYHDFGVMGRVRIMEFDSDAGLARVKVRCSETRGVPTLGYTGDLDEPVGISGIK